MPFALVDYEDGTSKDMAVSFITEPQRGSIWRDYISGDEVMALYPGFKGTS